MDKKYELKTIYDYTLTLYEKQEASLNRIDTKSSTFIGFSGVLIRLALDLPDVGVLEPHLKIGTCILSFLTIFLSSLGLSAKSSCFMPDPKFFMKDINGYFNLADPQQHQMGCIINGLIDVMDDNEKIAQIKQ